MLHLILFKSIDIDILFLCNYTISFFFVKTRIIYLLKESDHKK